MDDVVKKAIIPGHIRSSIIQTNLAAALLILGVFMLVKVRFPFLVIAGLSVVFTLAVVATIWTAYEKLTRGLWERVDEIGIYGKGYEEAFAKRMAFELEWVVLTLLVVAIFLFNTTGTGTAGELIEFSKIVWWFAFFINLFQLIFWWVRCRLMKKIKG